ncbi:hotdog fold thioesterase [Affinibrenneria salicis]|uniref:Hotdog fold thioesterase n=1 Tax=Affinibrenneria salicis TaxID=2590031 RepID=A0A5J5G2V9_9GAMM|nr:hotdog fold thioesterase [Affinibrenneria salicis]KAA9001237.1 hotdog fold thioesterase [Affinibrenneria salicis]
MLWKRALTLDQLNRMMQGCMIEHLGIRFVSLDDDRLEATMPVDQRTRQPHGLLHGGASVTLAESLGSVASYLCCEGDARVVGTEINASHLRAARDGQVRGLCRALHVGRRSHVWQIDIVDQQGKLCCAARLTVAVIGGG